MYATDQRSGIEAPAAIAGAAGWSSPAPGLADAVDALGEAVSLLASVDLGAEDDQALLDASVALQSLANRSAGQQVRILERVDAQAAFGVDGAVTAASWLRARTRMDHWQASHLVDAARRLRDLPRLRACLEEGSVTFAHVSAVTRAAVPRRMAAIAEHEDTLVELALAAQPRQVRVAVGRIRDLVDPDGSDPDGGGDAAPLDDEGPDERRSVDWWRTINGLWEFRGVLDALAGEELITALNSLTTPDSPDNPPQQRRSAGQRRADALAELARRFLDSGAAPVVAGTRPHVLVTIDLDTLLGRDAQASRTPRLRFCGEVSPGLARRIAADAKVTALLTMGPWRVVNVGRTHRTLPGWLRAALEMVHRHCRGPDCDRPAVWTEAHHQQPWTEHGDTDLNATIPLCKAHHDLVTTGRWHVRFDPDTGVCTWTSTTGRVIHTSPPPP